MNQQLEDRYYLLRLPVTLLLGGIAALVLTWCMHLLIQSTHPVLDESKRVHLLDFVRVKRNENSQRVERKPERPNQAPPPPAPPISSASSAADSGSVMSVEMPGAAVQSGVSGLAIGNNEGEYLPIIKVAPAYPPRAMQLRLEGTCMVEYTVTTSGATKDIRVVKGQCDHPAFERPSIAAAERFKYRPRIMNGEAVEVVGVKNRFIFELEE